MVRPFTARALAPVLSALVVLSALLGGAAGAAEPTWVDARVATYARYFQTSLLPGVPGAVAQVQPGASVTANAMVRFGAVDLPGAEDALSGEVAGWGAIGPFAPFQGLSGDGDVTSAWAQYRNKQLTVKLGRQIALPATSRFVRFDGVTLRLGLSTSEFEVYGGWVALPRWNQPRGYYVLGTLGDALKTPGLFQAEDRLGQFVVGARIGVQPVTRVRGSLRFFEQHDAVGTATRWLGAEVVAQATDWLGLGGNVSLDLLTLSVPEARAWVDVTKWERVSLSVDYAFQSPTLLLPQTSILSVFSGAAWHELGGEVVWRPLRSLKLSGRAAGQAFERMPLGARASAAATWSPGADGRAQFQAEASRLFVDLKGYVMGRLGARVRLTQALWTTIDSAVYHYDVPIRGSEWSLTTLGALEWRILPHLRTMGSVTAMATPYAAFEVQGLLRLILELEPVSGGNGA